MTEVSSIRRNSLAALEDSDVFPIDLIVAEAGPTMSSGLGNEFVKGTLPAMKPEERLASIGIVKCQLAVLLELLSSQRYEIALLREEISAVFRIMSVVIANAIGRILITGPAKVVLHRDGGRAVCLLAHDGLVSHYDCGSILGSAGEEGNSHCVVLCCVVATM